jgi:methyl-accepting chemotaxis protein
MSDQDDLARALQDLMLYHAFEVETALEAHADWKRRLRDAIVRGYCEHGSDEAGRDDLCALGQWLHALPLESRADFAYEDVLELHARFHREAAVVVQYLEMGRIDEARAAMDPDSAFALVSTELVCLLEAWRDAA